MPTSEAGLPLVIGRGSEILQVQPQDMWHVHHGPLLLFSGRETNLQPLADVS